MKQGFTLLLLCVAGCAGQRPLAPEVTHRALPDQWHGPVRNAPDEIPTRWWEAFGDPVLDQLVAQALTANVDLALADARVEEAEAQFESIDAQVRPNLYLLTQGGRSRSVSAFGRPQEQWAGEAQLHVNYDVDPFGRLRSARRAAAAGLDAVRYQRDNARLGVSAAVASGYFMLRTLDARLELVRATREVRVSSLGLAQRRLDSGYGTALEARQAEAELRSAEQLIPAVQLAILRQEHALSLLLGETARPIERGTKLSALSLPDPGAGVPTKLLRRRPDIAQAEAQLVATDRSLDAARAAFLPDLQLTAAGGVVDSTLLANPIGVYSLGAGLLAPLVDGGRLQAQQHAAAARRDQAALTYRRTVLQAVRDVEDALVTVEQARQQEIAIDQQREAIDAALQVARKRYAGGYSPYLEQIDAERALLSVDLALAQARNDRLLAVVYLFQSLGGGWTPDSPPR